METPVTKIVFLAAVGRGGRVHLKNGRRDSEKKRSAVENGRQARLKHIKDKFCNQCFSIEDIAKTILFLRCDSESERELYGHLKSLHLVMSVVYHYYES